MPISESSIALLKKKAALPKPAAPKQAATPIEPPPKAAAPAASNPPPDNSAKTATVEARRDSDGLRVTFSFGTPTPAALFRRADTVWLVFDQTKPIDIEPIRSKGGAIMGDVSRLPLEKGQAIRIRLNRPQALNALNSALIAELSQAIDAFEADPEHRRRRVRLVVGSRRTDATADRVRRAARRPLPSGRAPCSTIVTGGRRS